MARERRSMWRSGGDRARLVLAITPMIDVVFLLLVYFVLTSGFGGQERLLRAQMKPDDPGAPPAAQALALEEEPLVVRVARASGATVIALPQGLAQPADSAALERILRDALITAETPHGFYAADHPVRLAPARDVPWEDVVAVFRAVTGAGYRSIAFGGGS